MNKFVKVLGYSLVSIAIVSFMGHIVIEVIEGKGGDVYKSYKGLSFIPIGVLIFFVSIPFFAIIAKVLGWYLRREEMDFIRYVKEKEKLS